MMPGRLGSSLTRAVVASRDTPIAQISERRGGALRGVSMSWTHWTHASGLSSMWFNMVVNRNYPSTASSVCSWQHAHGQFAATEK